MPMPIIIKDEPERFRILWIAGDNYKNSDDQEGLIRSENEMEYSIEAACKFSSFSSDIPTFKTALMFAKTDLNLKKGATVAKTTALTDEAPANCHGDKKCEKDLKLTLLKLKKADIQIKAGEYESAAEELGRIVLNNLIENPQIAATYHALTSYSAFMLGHFKKTAFHLGQLMKNTEGSSKTAILSCFFELKNDPKSALGHFEKLEQKNLFAEKKDFITTSSLITLLKFFSAYSKVSRGQTKDPKLYMFVGSFLLHMGRFQESLECFNGYIKLLPNDHMGYWRKSQTLDMMYRYPEALESIKKAISLNKKEAGLFSLYGLILAHLDRYKEAIEQYDIAHKMDPKLLDPLIRKCLALTILDDKQGERSCIEKVLKEYPGASIIYHIRNELLLEKRRSKEKLNKLKKAPKQP